MGADHATDIDKHVRAYMMVFGALLVLTVVTVAIFYLHLSMATAIGLALIVATIKGSLVACYFMHLISERKLIYFVLLLTVFFFLHLLLLPVLTSIADSPGV
jgi:cytochrome c oxidase subunit 4